MHIVVADPSRTVLKAVSHLLENDGHIVTSFVDGREALDFIKRQADVSALITSAELDSLSGLELCWETRLLAGYDRAIYIILMSANVEQKQLVNALDNGADEFIRKPPGGEELYARLRSADRQLRLQRELIRLARVDPLTGVFNRRAFFEEGRRLCRLATVPRQPVAVMFDVDHFKQVNDTYGHDVGDRVLRAIGSAAPGEGGFVGRLGGEEFAILLNNADLAGGRDYAEELRVTIAALSFETSLGKMSVTASFGVAERQPGEPIDELLKRADAALYQAKHDGRNRVADAQPTGTEAGTAPWSGLVRSDIRSTREQHRALSLSRTDPLAGWPSVVEEPMYSPASSSASSSAYVNAAPPQAGRAYVLDDEPQIGALVGKVLQACGFTARQFVSPAPFLEELKALPPDLVVLDFALGQSNAIEVMRDLEVNRFRGKVLLISGRDEATLEEITRIGEKHGLVMLPPLKKPFRPGDVRRRLQLQSDDAAAPADKWLAQSA